MAIGSRSVGRVMRNEELREQVIARLGNMERAGGRHSKVERKGEDRGRDLRW